MWPSRATVCLATAPLAWRMSRTAARVGDNDDVRWHPLDRLGEVGLPAPVRKLLEGMPG